MQNRGSKFEEVVWSPPTKIVGRISHKLLVYRERAIRCMCTKGQGEGGEALSGVGGLSTARRARSRKTLWRDAEKLIGEDGALQMVDPLYGMKLEPARH